MSKAEEVIRGGERGLYSSTDRWHGLYHDTGRLGADPVRERANRRHWALFRGIARRVSAKAAKSPRDFVGEVFAGIATGKHYDSDVIALFDEIGGFSFPAG
jgi:hypothetical protein